MDKETAYKIIKRHYEKDNHNENDDFIFVEAANYLIETENDPEIMSCLGGFYYGREKYNLAEKYYLMADENGDKYASCGLGYIYYYGRNGQQDFKKAFYYYEKSMKFGNNESAMKIADMYHNGYGVIKDDEKYKEILLSLFDKIKDSDDLFEPYPEIAHRLADIYINENKVDNDIINMLIKARDFITQRIRFNPFWGNMIICRRVTQLLYKIIPFDEDNFDIFDLFYLFQKEHAVNFIYSGKTYTIESFYDEGQMRVKCLNKFYKSTEDFLINSMFENSHIYIIHYEDFYKLEIIK